MREFIHRANQLGAEGRSFFFLVDFEMKTPQIYTLEELKESGISASINGIDYGVDVEVARKIGVSITPIKNSFENYCLKFDRVMEGILHGDTYLLNLTERTPLEESVDLESVFYCAEAPYKIFKRGEFVCFSPEPFVEQCFHQKCIGKNIEGRN